MVTHQCRSCRVKPPQARRGRFVPRNQFLQNLARRRYKWECEACAGPTNNRAIAGFQRIWRARQVLRNRAALPPARPVRRAMVRPARRVAPPNPPQLRRQRRIVRPIAADRRRGTTLRRVVNRPARYGGGISRIRGGGPINLGSYPFKKRMTYNPTFPNETIDSIPDNKDQYMLLDNKPYWPNYRSRNQTSVSLSPIRQKTQQLFSPVKRSAYIGKAQIPQAEIHKSRIQRLQPARHYVNDLVKIKHKYKTSAPLYSSSDPRPPNFTKYDTFNASERASLKED